MRLLRVGVENFYSRLGGDLLIPWRSGGARIFMQSKTVAVEKQGRLFADEPDRPVVIVCAAVIECPGSQEVVIFEHGSKHVRYLDAAGIGDASLAYRRERRPRVCHPLDDIHKVCALICRSEE